MNELKKGEEKKKKTKISNKYNKINITDFH